MKKKEYTKEEIVELLKKNGNRIWIFDIDENSRRFPIPYEKKVAGIHYDMVKGTFFVELEKYFPSEGSQIFDWSELSYFNVKWAVDPEEFPLNHKQMKILKSLQEFNTEYNKIRDEITALDKQRSELYDKIEKLHNEKEELKKEMKNKLDKDDVNSYSILSSVINNY